MEQLLNYIRGLCEDRETLKHIPNAHVNFPTLDEILDKLDELRRYAEVEYEQD